MEQHDGERRGRPAPSVRVRLGIGTVLLAIAASTACGGGDDMSLAEYAEEVEGLVNSMNFQLDELEDELGVLPTFAATQDYMAERVAARRQFLEALQAVTPPHEAGELHDAAVRVISRLTEAESALSDRLAATTDGVTLAEVWQMPEARAARAADREAVELCQAAQSELDSTQDRAALGDAPWVPPEMKEVVIVTFNCTGDDG